jgi:hypothetical protein
MALDSFVSLESCQECGRPTRRILPTRMLTDCHITRTTVMFRSDVFRALGGYRSRFPDAEDYDLFLRINDAHKIDNLPIVLAEYRLHSGQVSYRNVRQQIISGIGARLATRQRRSSGRETIPTGKQITEGDLVRSGVTMARIEAFARAYLTGNLCYADGWRWRNSPFCVLSD